MRVSNEIYWLPFNVTKADTPVAFFLDVFNLIEKKQASI